MKFVPLILLGSSSFREHVIPYQEIFRIELRRGEARRSDIALIHFYFGKEASREFVLGENDLGLENLEALISTIAQKNPHVKLGNITVE